MPVPTFDLAIIGTAPDQYTTENLLETEVNRVLNALHGDIVANIGKIFQSRQQAVDAGQAAIPVAYGVIVTIEGDDLKFRTPGNAGSTNDPLFPGSYPSWPVSLIIPSSAKIFGTRQAAVDFGQENLPASLDIIITSETNGLALRGPLSASRDPLFATSPYWGIDTLVPSITMLRAAGIIPLTVDAVSTANAIIANLGAAFAVMNTPIAADTFVSLRTSATNLGPVTLTVPGAAPEDPPFIDSFPVYDADGNELQGGEIKAGRTYILQRRGTTFRMTTAAAEEQTNNQSLAPGDIAVLAQDADGSLAQYYDDEGRLHGHIVLDEVGVAPGDEGWTTVIADADGRALVEYNYLTEEIWPGAVDDGGGGSGVASAVPQTEGRYWNAHSIGTDLIEYISDQWGGRVYGFLERLTPLGHITIAQSPAPAAAVVGFGGGALGAERTITDRYPFHVLDPDLGAAGAMDEAGAANVISCASEDAANQNIYTSVRVSAVQSSITSAEALGGSALRQKVIDDLTEARDGLLPFGHTLSVDRIHLSLLDGEPATLQSVADFHYAAVADGLRDDIVSVTGVAQQPVIVVCQSIGTRIDGTSEVILAEGRLDLEHWSLGFVVATPLYPFALQPGTSIPTADEALRISELCDLASKARVAEDQLWYCPMLTTAVLSGTTVTATFDALSDLVLDDAVNHGFTLSGDSNGAAISSVSVSGKTAIIELSAAPSAGAVLQYAFGQIGEAGDGFAANRGSIRDSWTEAGALSGTALYRHALSARAEITS